MRFVMNITVAVMLMAALLMAGCGEAPHKENAEPHVKLLDTSWNDIEKQAHGTEVRFYMYGGFAHVNNWIDNYVAKELKDRYDIKLVRVPMDAGVFVNKLITEKSAGKTVGSIDLLWINGENFKATKEAGTLFGPYADKLPNFNKYVDKGLAGFDFGYPVEGYETPYGRAMYVFEFDSARTLEHPESFTNLLEWVKAHPGKFTYPQPPDFTGSAFIRQAFYAVSGGPDQYMHGWNENLFNENAPKLWAYLNELKPYLWQEGKSYPKGSAELDTLFARGEVDINMSYHPLHAQSKILDGTYPDSVRTFIMNEGSLFNLHFTAIPANAPNKAGAMVAANFLMSPEAQLSKLDPSNWGDFPAIVVNMLPEEERKQFDAMDLGAATLTPEELSKQSLPEIPAEYLEALEKGWEENVLR
ncbi:ABC transporter substrate-binding protein [Pseudodesulfovibrio sp. zrk46]|uniref:ABC transporter substrate-binding protein n=1 Tax=Pseudodesulfovibrio sp. zrk46 TaxID=2725288 RepID=UPI001448D148|nr:ABC transporter substrate-binding protein [Pseudodesulfovibrio sp. zrk46]QJB56732.1 ABC transporter substrate-binding protein [Pseudodesulfovibrio sp. zrk46]